MLFQAKVTNKENKDVSVTNLIDVAIWKGRFSLAKV
jgi:hypothetical protein